MKQFHCLKNETSYLCTSIIHPIWLILPFPLHTGFRPSFHCLLGKPNYWLQVSSWLSYPRQSSKSTSKQTTFIHLSCPHLKGKCWVFLQPRDFFFHYPLEFPDCFPVWLPILDKELLQASHCQMNFTQSLKITSVALNLHPHYPNTWLAELHMSKTGFSISWSLEKQPSNNLPYSYIMWVSFHHQETSLSTSGTSLVAFLQRLYMLLQKVRKAQNADRENLE